MTTVLQTDRVWRLQFIGISLESDLDYSPSTMASPHSSALWARTSAPSHAAAWIERNFCNGAQESNDGHIMEVKPWNSAPKNKKTFPDSNGPRNRQPIQKPFKRRRKSPRKNS